MAAAWVYVSGSERRLRSVRETRWCRESALHCRWVSAGHGSRHFGSGPCSAQSRLGRGVFYLVRDVPLLIVNAVEFSRAAVTYHPAGGAVSGSGRYRAGARAGLRQRAAREVRRRAAQVRCRPPHRGAVRGRSARPAEAPVPLRRRRRSRSRLQGPTGVRIRQIGFQKHKRAAMAHDQVTSVHFHDLRHTGNTLTAHGGANLSDVMTGMGPSSTRVARIYLHTHSGAGSCGRDRPQRAAHGCGT